MKALNSAIQLFVLLSFTLKFTARPALAQKDPPAPKTIPELGYTTQQKAVGVEGEVVWMDEEALKRDFPELRPYDFKQLKDLILTNFAFLTELQISCCSGIYITEPNLLNVTRMLYHPKGYNRASVAEFILPDQQGKSIGLIDLKGTGSSPHRQGALAELIIMIDILKGKIKFSTKQTEEFKRERDRIRSQLSVLEKKKTKRFKPDRLRQHQHMILQTQINLEMAQYILGVIQQRETLPRDVLPSDVEGYLEIVRKRDYSNGAATLSRVMKEVIVQKNADALMSESNSRAAVSWYSTVDTYFIIAFDHYAYSNGEKERAAVVGRQPHWRFGNLSFPGLPEKLKIADAFGATQFDAFGRLVDTEQITIGDFRVENLMQLPSGSGIDVEARQVVAKFESGEKDAIKDYMSKMIGRIRPLTKRSMISDLNFKYFEDLQEVSRLAYSILSDKESIQALRKILEDRNESAVLLAVMLKNSFSNPGWIEIFWKMLETQFSFSFKAIFRNHVLFALAQQRPTYFDRIRWNRSIFSPDRMEFYTEILRRLVADQNEEALFSFTTKKRLRSIPFWLALNQQRMVRFAVNPQKPSILNLNENQGEIEREAAQQAMDIVQGKRVIPMMESPVLHLRSMMRSSDECSISFNLD